MALGSEVDLHTPNLESASMDWQGRNQNSMMLLPGAMETADVKLSASGNWIFQCRVAEHLADGQCAICLQYLQHTRQFGPSVATA